MATNDNDNGDDWIEWVLHCSILLEDELNFKVDTTMHSLRLLKRSEKRIKGAAENT